MGNLNTMTIWESVLKAGVWWIPEFPLPQFNHHSKFGHCHMMLAYVGYTSQVWATAAFTR